MIDRKFLLAGNAIFTIRNNKTGNRFTFNVRKPSTNSPHFVSVLTGPNNQADYKFLGTIFDGKTYHYGKKSTIAHHALSAKCFKWLWENLDNLPRCIEIFHEGYCGKCGRGLTTPESIEIGFGPVCLANLKS